MDDQQVTASQSTADVNHDDAVKVPRRTTRSDTDNCTICLCPISERAVAAPCNHLSFDFLCLVQWLQSSAQCPLCKAAVVEVQYDFRDHNDYKRYVVPRALLSSATSRSFSEPYRHAGEESRISCFRGENPALWRRRQVYEHQLYSLHVGSSAYSGYTDFTTQTFATSPGLQARARTFLRRELHAIDAESRVGASAQTGGQRRQKSTLRRRQATTDYLVEFIIAVMRTHEAKSFDDRAAELLSEFMAVDNAHLLLHELTHWLRSPYVRLDDWDNAVQY